MESSVVQSVLPPDGIMRTGKSYYSMWDTVFEIDNHYVPIEPKGQGNYGVVCSAFDQRTKEKVAIKRISNVFEGPTTARRTLREMAIQRQIKHDNVLGLKDVLVPSNSASFDEIYLVYELMGADLSRIIDSKQPLSEDQIQAFIYQILSGLYYLHTANVLHRDLKPGNILINKNCDLKIADFGLARTIPKSGSESMTDYVVSRWYRAPELLLGSNNYGPAIDVWSVGCILAELFLRIPMFRGTGSLNQLKCITSQIGIQKDDDDFSFIQTERGRRYLESLPDSSKIPFAETIPDASPLALDLLERMLVFNPRKRITVIEALKHPYLQDLYEPRTDCPAQFQVKLDGVEESMEKDEIRKLMWDEIRYHHPDLAIARRSHTDMSAAESVPSTQSSHKKLRLS